MADCTTPDEHSGFVLQLADDQRWVVSPTADTCEWVREFARILRLRAQPVQTSDSILVVCKNVDCGDSANALLAEKLVGYPAIDLPAAGWKRDSSHSVVQEWRHPDTPAVLLSIGAFADREAKYSKMARLLHVIFRRALENGGFTCHAALIEKSCRAFLLCGPSGAGKSTCCRRLPNPWVPLCDDSVLVVRHKQKGFLAHPFPTWSDYICNRSAPTWDVQYNLPIHGMFFLQQADQDNVAALGQAEAANLLKAEAMGVFAHRWWRLYDKQRNLMLRRKMFENVCDLSLRVPAFRLDVSYNGTFWKHMEGQAGVL